MLLTSHSHAAEPSASIGVNAKGTSLPRARELFFQGLAEQNAGNWERALAFFQQSLAEAPTWQSTLNAASCLGKLARYDEALTTYEDLLRSFAAQLDPAERARVDVAMAYLQQKVASLEVTANVVAEVIVDGRPRGEVPRGGPFVLRVTADTHRVEIVKEGFKPFDRTRAFAPGASIIFDAVLEKAPLPAPAAPPASPVPQPYPSFSAFAGGVLSGSLGSTAERRDSAVRSGPVGGFVAGLRGGYTLSFGLALEVTVGYLYAVSAFHRNVDRASFVDRNPENPIEVTYDLKDTLRLRGPFFGLGASYRIPLDDRLSVLVRTTFGVLEARSTDPVQGKVCSGSGCVPGDGVKVIVRGSSQILTSTSGFLLPEVGLDARWGAFRAGISLGLFLLTADGPSFKRREAGVDPAACTGAAPTGSVACAPNRSLGESDPNDGLDHGNRELAYGGFTMLWMPRVSAGYSF